MPEAEPILLTRIEAGVATLTLNRPEAHNTLSVALLTELERTLATLAVDRAVKVVVLAANGRAFCAGYDVREMCTLEGRAPVAALFALCARVMTAIVRLPQPVIAKVHGAAAAAGCQLVASCDLAYASTTARFATPGINLGLFCSTPGVALARAVGRKDVAPSPHWQKVVADSIIPMAGARYRGQIAASKTRPITARTTLRSALMSPPSPAPRPAYRA
ncbi:enoyl-CoA hydratase-related protein [Azospirillum sp. TSO22-1]|uniref:enoyl-CoA hydratase-related protein n=1 Tax=Azospirillum sp. TSO22-1 TaxID=716789 RepID=UPI000D64ED05|nr:enoyl-CoA hydratase-related protein [Azospirillum sp. TSO22-1]